MKKMPSHHQVTPLNTKLCDVRDTRVVSDLITEFSPDVVIHCAAYTAVDQAETEKTLCWDINVNGSINVAKACEAIKAKMILISTDYVFDGEGTEPYGVFHPTRPLNEYGKSKAEAEIAVSRIVSNYFIVRTSWMFGDGGNFVRTIRRIAQDNHRATVVTDQIGSPTYSEDLADLLIDMAETEAYGTYHVTNEGFCSWADLAEETMNQLNIDADILRVTSPNFPMSAKRPLNSRLSKDCLDNNGFYRLPSWQDALQRYLKDHEGALKLV